MGATLQELPGYLSSKFHAGTLLIAVAVGIAYAGTAAGRPFAGRAGDAGRSRATGLCGCLLASAAGAGHLLAPDIGALIAARIVMGLGEAALFSGLLPWVLTVFDLLIRWWAWCSSRPPGRPPFRPAASRCRLRATCCPRARARPA
jgi:MFS family permease